MSRGIVILYNLPAESGDSEINPWLESDAGILAEVEAVAGAAEKLGIPFGRAGIRRLADIPAALQDHPDWTVFNLVERLDGGISHFNFVPILCATLRRRVTGGTSECLMLTLDKWLTKARLQSFGIATPPACVVPPGARLEPRAVPPPPLIVKPLSSDGSEGIDERSLVRDPGAALADAVERVHSRCQQPALIEQYIEGREFNLSLFERRGAVEVLPLAEIDFSLFPAGRPHIVDYAVKWISGTIPGHVSPRRFPSDLDPNLARRLREQALNTWRACGCRDYVRIDFRVDRAGEPFVLEINANPDLSPKAGFPAALAAGGIPFADFVRQMLDNTQSRQ